MLYSFLTLDDETEITHSEFLPFRKNPGLRRKNDGNGCFHHMSRYLSDYSVKGTFGFDDNGVKKYMEIIRSTAHPIMKFSKKCRFDNAPILSGCYRDPPCTATSLTNRNL